MKKTLLITICALVLFASVGHAQNGRLYVATDVGVFVSVAQSGALTTLDLPAGQPMKFRVAGGGVKELKLIRTQIPCGAGGGASGQPSEHVLTKSKNTYLFGTQSSWRGTCQLFAVRVGNEPELYLKVQFV